MLWYLHKRRWCRLSASVQGVGVRPRSGGRAWYGKEARMPLFGGNREQSPSNTVICPSCHEENPVGAIICHGCRGALPPPVQAQPQTSSPVTVTTVTTATTVTAPTADEAARAAATVASATVLCPTCGEPSPVSAIVCPSCRGAIPPGLPHQTSSMG